jgi:3-hydroxyisobutyrate dehydrogenase
MIVGWVGTGILGSAILRCLSKKVDILAWNRTISKVKEISGIRIADSLFDLAVNSDIIFLCLGSEAAYEHILFKADSGLAYHLRSGSLIVDTSTISPELSVAIGTKLKKFNLRFVECPVSGGPEGAVEGTLSAIMAGVKNDIDEAQLIVRHFCKKINFVGELGNAQKIKILNNLAESINLLAAAEVVSIGIALGLNLKTLYEVLQTTRGYSVYMGVLFERLLKPSKDVSASLEIRMKDVRLANAIADSNGLCAPLATLAKELFEKAIHVAGPNSDQTECFKIYKAEENNVER